MVDAALRGGTESYMSAAFKIRTGSNPVLTTIARVVELVDTPDLGSGDFGHESSSLSSGTK